MKATLFLFKLTIFFLFTASCGNTANSQDAKNQSEKQEIKYPYIANSYFVEKDISGDIIWDFNDTIMAMDDEDAYLQAYEGVCTYLAINALGKKGDSRFHLQKLELLNSEGIDILPKIDFADRKRKEDSIWAITKKIFDR